MFFFAVFFFVCVVICFFFFICLLCSISSKHLYNALYPRATLQALLNTCCKAGFVTLLKTTGFDVAKKLSTSIRPGSAAQQGVDFDPHIQILRQSKQGSKLTLVETCVDMYTFDLVRIFSLPIMLAPIS